MDAALAKSGTLSGRVYNAQGTPLAGVDVFVVASRGEATRVRTNERGEFAADGLKGGVYHLTAGHGSQSVRAWTEGTAPPAAERQILIVSDPRVALGQYERADPRADPGSEREAREGEHAGDEPLCPAEQCQEEHEAHDDPVDARQATSERTGSG